MSAPSMDDKATPSPPTRTGWQFEADKLLGFNGPPWPTDEARRAALIGAGLAHWIPTEPAAAPESDSQIATDEKSD